MGLNILTHMKDGITNSLNIGLTSIIFHQKRLGLPLFNLRKFVEILKVAKINGQARMVMAEKRVGITFFGLKTQVSCC